MHTGRRLRPGEIGGEPRSDDGGEADRITIIVQGRGGMVRIRTRPTRCWWPRTSSPLAAEPRVAQRQSARQRRGQPVLGARRRSDGAFSDPGTEARIVGTVRTFRREVQGPGGTASADLCESVALAFGAAATAQNTCASTRRRSTPRRSGLRPTHRRGAGRRAARDGNLPPSMGRGFFLHAAGEAGCLPARLGQGGEGERVSCTTAATISTTRSRSAPVFVRLPVALARARPTLINPFRRRHDLSGQTFPRTLVAPAAPGPPSALRANQGD